MEKYIDLHVHSNCSDGTMTPTEVVEHAAKKGLSAIALTDHDTINGIAEAKAAAKTYGVEVIPGIEFSTNYQGKDIHILGLNVNVDNNYFVTNLQQFLDSRDVRNQKIINLLAEQGIDISWESMKEAFPQAVWTRANFARYLLDRHYIKSMQDAFSRYIGEGCPCYVPREKVTPYQAIHLIHEGGGYAILAHPLLYHFNETELETLVDRLVQAGLDGIEAIYSKNRWTDESNMRRLARKFNLKITGGSDFHGDNKPDIDIGTGRGNLKIPYSIWKQLCD